MAQAADILGLHEQDEEDTLKGKYLIFTMGSELYGMEIRYITEIIGIQPITEVPEMPGYVRGITNLRGKIIPVRDARLRLRKPCAITTTARASSYRHKRHLHRPDCRQRLRGPGHARRGHCPPAGDQQGRPPLHQGRRQDRGTVRSSSTARGSSPTTRPFPSPTPSPELSYFIKQKSAFRFSIV